MSESPGLPKVVGVSIAGVTRWFVVVRFAVQQRVYQLAISDRKQSAQMQLADPAVVPLVLREARQQ
jgi:hypothetical protein